MTEDLDIRAAQARDELSLTAETFDAIRNTLISSLIATKLGEDRLREKYALTIQGLDAVRTALEKMVAAPKDAETIKTYLASLKEQMAT